MSRDLDHGYEILDLGQPAAGDPKSPVRVLPRLELGELSGERQSTNEQPRKPTRRQWLAIVLTFILGVASGAYGWSLRQQAADDAEQAAQAEIIAGNVIGQVDPASEIQHLGLLMLNNGPREVEVLNAHPLGWAMHGSRPVTIPSSQWAAVRISVEPVCDSPPPTELAVQVRTDAGNRTITVPLPPGRGTLSEAHDQVCGADPGVRYAINAGRISLLDSAEPETLLMRVELRPAVPATNFDVTAVNASAGGFLATATNLPIVFTAVQRSPRPLDLSWQITSCEATALLGDVAPQLTITLPDETTYRTHVVLPGEAVAMLARFATTECGEET